MSRINLRRGISVTLNCAGPEVFSEIGDYCTDVGVVSWQSPKPGGYFYARIWHRKDPQRIVKCCHRHREGTAALKCGEKYIRSGEVRTDFSMDNDE